MKIQKLHTQSLEVPDPFHSVLEVSYMTDSEQLLLAASNCRCVGGDSTGETRPAEIVTVLGARPSTQQQEPLGTTTLRIIYMGRFGIEIRDAGCKGRLVSCAIAFEFAAG